MRAAIQKALGVRMLDWAVVTLIMTAVIWLLAPHQLGVTAYKMSLVSLAAVVGYWIDRSIFPYARPDDLPTLERSDASLRRAIIVAACIVGVSLGA